MNNVQIFDDNSGLAESAAKQAVTILQNAIEGQGSSTWVVAGGSTPLLAYKIIAATCAEALDWSKVTVVIGDERIGPLDGPDNNWHAIDQILGKLPIKKLLPQSDQTPEFAADNYQQQLSALPKSDAGLPRFDLVWLGVGSDGHTLSIFPRHESMLPTDRLVIPIHASPKPPPDRISLSLRALIGTRSAMILASGEDKQAAVTAALSHGSSPIALASSIINTHEGHVTWLVDKSAAPTD